MTARFYYLLHKQAVPKFTTERLARAIGSGRCHVNKVLNNRPDQISKHPKTQPGRNAHVPKYHSGKIGGRTRRKLAAYFQQHFQRDAAEMLAELGWDENGDFVPRETCDVAQLDQNTQMPKHTNTQLSVIGCLGVWVLFFTCL